MPDHPITRDQPASEEVAHLEEIERQLRAYITNYFDPHSRQHDRTFAPGTIRFVEEVRPLLEQLNHIRDRR